MMAGPPAPSGSASPLDAPPPSTQLAGGGPGGQATPMSLQGLAGPVDPMRSGQMPPEILSGILSSAEKIGSLLDSYAQVAPDLAMEFDIIKSQIAAVLAKLVERGAQPSSPQAVGSQPPMGGIDRGISSGGSV